MIYAFPMSIYFLRFFFNLFSTINLHRILAHFPTCLST